MEIQITIADYDPACGFTYIWEKGFKIRVGKANGQVQIAANKAGLISLAQQLLALAQDNLPEGTHLHYDMHNSLEDDSVEMVIERL